MKALRNFLFAAVGLVILVGALVPSLSHARGFGFAFGFANRVAGSFFGFLTIEGIPPLPLLITINRDGTAQTSLPNQNASTNHGNWRRTGRRKISGTLFGLAFDPSIPAILGIDRTDFTQEYSEDFSTIHVQVSTTFFACNPTCADADPFDPEAGDPGFDGEITADRIPAGADADNAD